MHFVLLFLIHQPARANMSSQYMQQVVESAKQMRLINDKMRKGDRSLCPEAKSKSQSACFRNFVQTSNLESSTEIVELAVIAASVALKDKGSTNARNLTLAENLITVM